MERRQGAAPLEEPAKSWLLAFYAVLVAVIGGMAWLQLGRAADDIFITYRYASHLAAGLGLVFNPGERVFGVSDPGVAVMLGLARVAGADIPAAGTALTGAAILAVCAVIVRHGQRRARLPEAAAAAALIAVFPALWLGQGSGPLVALAALLGAASGVDSRPWSAGMLAGIAVWCRPDAVLGAALLGWFVRRDPIVRRRYALTLGAVIIVGAAGAYAAFGTLIPNTLVAKRAFAANDPGFFSRGEFWRRAYAVFDWSSGGSAVGLLVLAAWGLVRSSLEPSKPLRLLAVYGVASGVFYTLVGVPYFLWYSAPLTAAVLVSAPLAVGDLVRIPGRQFARTRLATGLVALCCLGLVVPTAARSWRWSRQPSTDWRLWAYRTAGEWIAGHTPEDADIAIPEVGIVGYYSRRPVRDLVGLVSPELLPYAATGDLRGAFLFRPAELVVFHTFDHRGGTRPIVSRQWFPAAYHEAARFQQPGGEGQVVVFRRTPGGPALPTAGSPRTKPPAGDLPPK